METRNDFRNTADSDLCKIVALRIACRNTREDIMAPAHFGGFMSLINLIHAGDLDSAYTEALRLSETLTD